MQRRERDPGVSDDVKDDKREDSERYIYSEILVRRTSRPLVEIIMPRVRVQSAGWRGTLPNSVNCTSAQVNLDSNPRELYSSIDTRLVASESLSEMKLQFRLRNKLTTNQIPNLLEPYFSTFIITPLLNLFLFSYVTPVSNLPFLNRSSSSTLEIRLVILWNFHFQRQFEKLDGVLTSNLGLITR
jgi:hypothetical protein